jgi:hypothetical protein
MYIKRRIIADNPSPPLPLLPPPRRVVFTDIPNTVISFMFTFLSSIEDHIAISETARRYHAISALPSSAPVVLRTDLHPWCHIPASVNTTKCKTVDLRRAIEPVILAVRERSTKWQVWGRSIAAHAWPVLRRIVFPRELLERFMDAFDVFPVLPAVTSVSVYYRPTGYMLAHWRPDVNILTGFTRVFPGLTDLDLGTGEVHLPTMAVLPDTLERLRCSFTIFDSERQMYMPTVGFTQVRHLRITNDDSHVNFPQFGWIAGAFYNAITLEAKFTRPPPEDGTSIFSCYMLTLRTLRLDIGDCSSLPRLMFALQVPRVHYPALTSVELDCACTLNVPRDLLGEISEWLNYEHWMGFGSLGVDCSGVICTHEPRSSGSSGYCAKFILDMVWPTAHFRSVSSSSSDKNLISYLSWCICSSSSFSFCSLH